MRLYCKLFILIFASVCMHRFVLNDWRHSETLFMTRCYLAHLTGDKALEERVLADAQYFVENDASFLQASRTNATLGRR